MRENFLMVYFGHHKCASSYIVKIINDICAIYGLAVRIDHLSDKLPYEYHLKGYWKQELEKMFASDLTDDFDFRCYTNASSVLVDRLKGIPHRGFHVIRDPRDILVSGYFSHKYSHSLTRPWHFKIRERLLKVDQEEGLLCELEYSSVFLERLAAWDYLNPNVYETRFETVVQDPYNEFRRILGFIGFEFKSDREAFLNIFRRKFFRKRWGRSVAAGPGTCSSYILRRTLGRYSFEKLAGGRKRGTEDQKAHYRKGVSGDWKCYFTPTVKEEFKKKYGRLLINLGYENDSRW